MQSRSVKFNDFFTLVNRVKKTFLKALSNGELRYFHHFWAIPCDAMSKARMSLVFMWFGNSVG